MKDWIKKLGSRKLAAFLVATAALWFGVIDQNTWEAVALGYLGSQGLVDLAEAGLGLARKKAEGTIVESTPAKVEK